MYLSYIKIVIKFLKHIVSILLYPFSSLLTMDTKDNTPKKDFIIFYDLETTGLNPYHSKIIEISALLYSCETGTIVKHFTSLVNPQIPLPNIITRIQNT